VISMGDKRGPQAEAIVGVRREHPSWGPKKAAREVARGARPATGLARIEQQFGELLRRQGLSEPRKYGRRPREFPSAKFGCAAQ